MIPHDDAVRGIAAATGKLDADFGETESVVLTNGHGR